MSCAAGLAALRILIEERLVANAEQVGRYFRDGLESLLGRGEVVEVRGLGLMLGLRFADAGATRRFVEGALARGLLLGWTLHCDNLIRITPPLILTRSEVDEALEKMRDALGGASA